MARVDFEHRRGIGHLVPGLLEHTAQVQGHVVFVEDEAGRRFGQAPADLDVTHALAEQFLEPGDHGRCRFLAGLVRLAGGGIEFDLALADVAQLLAGIFGQVARHPLVDAIGHQQHLDPLGLERFELRTALGGGVGVGGDVPDDLLPGLHAADVVIQRNGRRRTIGPGRGEAQQFGDALAIAGVLGDAFLEHAAEGGPEGRILLRLVGGQLVEQIEDAFRAGTADAFDLAILLKDLAADVERQVVGVDHTAHEAQVGRQQLFAGIHDENTTDVELEALALLAAVHEIEGGLGRHVEQRGEVLVALDTVVGPGQGVVEIVAQGLVEVLIVLVLELALRARPQGRGRIDGFPFLAGLAIVELGHADRKPDVVGVARDQAAQLPGLEELLFVFLQVQRHGSAALRHVDRFEGVLALPVALPAHALACRRTGAAAGHGDAVGYDEGRVKAHSKLPDQATVGLFVCSEGFEVASRARTRNGAEVGDQLVTVHADAVVMHAERARRGVEGYVDAQFRIVGHPVRMGQCLEAQLVAGVGGVRNQFAKEDFLVRVERMGDQVQDLGDFGFELSGFSSRAHGQGSREVWICPARWGCTARFSTASGGLPGWPGKTIRPPCGGRIATRSTDATQCSKTEIRWRGGSQS